MLKRLKNKVVVFDLDGTLLDSQNEIIGGIETLNCLDTLQRAGCTLAICTGRLDHDIIMIDQKYHLNIEERISQNGAVINTRNHCEATLLDKQEALHIYDYIKNLEIRIELNTISNRYWKTKRDPLFPKELYDSHILYSDFKNIILYQPAILFLIVGEKVILSDIAEYINSHYKMTKAVMTSETSLEIMHISASKGHAVECLYADQYVYAIGDSPNDFDMFLIADKGYLVSDKECSYSCIRKPNILEALKEIISQIE